MKRYTVRQLAELAGVSVRTLHYYDEIGLLQPAQVGDNGYRYYTREELLRLQQILILRELDMPLQVIGTLLDQPTYDRLAALLAQRRQLQARAEHYRELVETIDRTIADIKGDRKMQDEALYRGVISPEKQIEYEQWLEQRYGTGIRPAIDEDRRMRESMGDAGVTAYLQVIADIESELAAAMRRGIDPASTQLEALIDRHHAWVARSWRRTPTPEAYASLAELYLAHPDFVARYESLAGGFADYLAQAMKAWAGRASGGSRGN